MWCEMKRRGSAPMAEARAVQEVRRDVLSRVLKFSHAGCATSGEPLDGIDCLNKNRGIPHLVELLRYGIADAVELGPWDVARVRCTHPGTESGVILAEFDTVGRPIKGVLVSEVLAVRHLALLMSWGNLARHVVVVAGRPEAALPLPGHVVPAA